MRSIMCGRFTLRTPPTSFWPADQLDLFSPRFNVAPTQFVDAVRIANDIQALVKLRWGLIPSWAKDEKIGYRMINARSETVAEKPSFRTAFRRRRCLILADGYYEWKTIQKQKQPYYIQMQDGKPFAFAGLWESWPGPKDARRDQPLETCTVLTTESNELTSGVHDRMPVILKPEDHEFWMDPEFESTDKLSELFRPYSSDEMKMYAVSTLVNKPANDQPECVKPLEAA